jgi:hypothetical protein
VETRKYYNSFNSLDDTRRYLVRSASSSSFFLSLQSFSFASSFSSSSSFSSRSGSCLFLFLFLFLLLFSSYSFSSSSFSLLTWFGCGIGAGAFHPQVNRRPVRRGDEEQGQQRAVRQQFAAGDCGCRFCCVTLCTTLHTENSATHIHCYGPKHHTAQRTHALQWDEADQQ